mmetsp:Transcript_14169/g.40167  ORF Transcript_14169/g.40167 Transcript_14169/m.40167 type:complete len:412 (-) Transcript_14169:3-1238(-)
MQILEALRSELLANIPHIRRLVDSIALLDMLVSFADVAASANAAGKEYCKPKIYSSNMAPLVIVGGRHALLEAQLNGDDEGQQECAPNDTYMSFINNLAIVTGPNMSGKSTYLRHVGLVVVMAQAGCFVPASYTSLAPFAGVFTRAVHSGASATAQQEGSSFMLEMRETAQVLRSIAPRSLVLMDELGRATSTADGLAISLAVAEALATAPAFTVFTTHFPALAELATVQPACKLWHFQVNVEDNSLKFTWKMQPGAKNVREYGILLAEHNGFPDEVTSLARHIASLLYDGPHDHSSGAGGATPLAGGAAARGGAASVRYQLPESVAAMTSAQPRAAETPRPARPVLSAQELRAKRHLLSLTHKVACIALAASGSGGGGGMSTAEACAQLRPLKEEAQAIVRDCDALSHAE